MAEREVRYRIVGDASSGVEGARQSGNALGRFGEKTQEASKHLEGVLKAAKRALTG
jgi:hypothetical protein